MRTRRVGSVTCGVLLILFGILFFLHILLPAITFEFIFRLWPLVLIFLGIEILISNLKGWSGAMKYDVGASVLLFALAFFAMAMGAVEIGMEISEDLHWASI